MEKGTTHTTSRGLSWSTDLITAWLTLFVCHVNLGLIFWTVKSYGNGWNLSENVFRWNVIIDYWYCDKNPHWNGQLLKVRINPIVFNGLAINNSLSINHYQIRDQNKDLSLGYFFQRNEINILGSFRLKIYYGKPNTPTPLKARFKRQER